MCVVIGSLFVVAWTFVEIFCATTNVIWTKRANNKPHTCKLDMIIVLCVCVYRISSKRYSYFCAVNFFLLLLLLLILHKCVIAFRLYIIVTSLKLIKTRHKYEWCISMFAMLTIDPLTIRSWVGIPNLIRLWVTYFVVSRNEIMWREYQMYRFVLFISLLSNGGCNEIFIHNNCYALKVVILMLWPVASTWIIYTINFHCIFLHKIKTLMQFNVFSRSINA